MLFTIKSCFNIEFNYYIISALYKNINYYNAVDCRFRVR